MEPAMQNVIFGEGGGWKCVNMPDINGSWKENIFSSKVRWLGPNLTHFDFFFQSA